MAASQQTLNRDDIEPLDIPEVLDIPNPGALDNFGLSVDVQMTERQKGRVKRVAA